ncbi:protein TonB [Novosphingobium sp. CF614]|uniref:energy transducer TonB n=1 Tax=Novosphingobium sp. CF614 TaxID=1884364 RepID=UPI0008F06CAB|nr:energy transducer TonB [Novosphingobium sp. CF614]SFF96039.1 protein TonB [Novosphingobium sp. CF614]
MSYLDGNSGNGRKALTGGTVALIQAGLALALVNGFAVAFIEPDPPRHLPTQFYPTAPLPTDPVDPPKANPEKPLVRDTFVDAAKPTVAVPNNSSVEVTPQPATGPTDNEGTGDYTYIRPVPADPPARFTPAAAKARGDLARWVTTDDYPTFDIRAGHAGTVRFLLAIDSGGRVTDCTIVESSGYPGLDAATCRNVTRRARFDPATDAAGERVAGSYSGTIRWVIPRD